MAKQSNVSNQSVAAAIANAMVGIDTSGICETICENLLARFGKGGAVSKEDGDAIAAEVSRLRKWTPKSAETRIKELRAFYGAYDLLPLALEKLRETKSNGKPITYDAGVKLARSLKAGKTVSQSVAAYIEGKAARSEPTVGEPSGSPFFCLRELWPPRHDTTRVQKLYPRVGNVPWCPCAVGARRYHKSAYRGIKSWLESMT
jgi:hypothetical protein